MLFDNVDDRPTSQLCGHSKFLLLRRLLVIFRLVNKNSARPAVATAPQSQETIGD
jgi:hypothetical protein